MATLLFFDQDHRYTLDGEDLPSVSELCRFLSGKSMAQSSNTRLTVPLTVAQGYIRRVKCSTFTGKRIYPTTSYPMSRPTYSFAATTL